MRVYNLIYPTLSLLGMEKPKRFEGETYFHIGKNNTLGDFTKVIMTEMAHVDFPASALDQLAWCLKNKTWQDKYGATKHQKWCEDTTKKAEDDYHKEILANPKSIHIHYENSSKTKGVTICTVKCDECNEVLSSAEVLSH